MKNEIRPEFSAQFAIEPRHVSARIAFRPAVCSQGHDRLNKAGSDDGMGIVGQVVEGFNGHFSSFRAGVDNRTMAETGGASSLARGGLAA